MARAVGNPGAIVVNLAAFCTGAYAVYYTSNKIVLPPHLLGAGHWQFLTNISLLLAEIVFFLGTLAHILKSERLFNLKNNIHPFTLALECVVAGVYWPLRLMFLHILVKDPTASFIPLSVDLCLHLYPVVGLLVDYFFFMPKWALTSTQYLVLSSIFTSLYWWWLKVIIDFENGGEYPYMFLNVPHELTRIMIFALVSFLGFVLFWTLRALYDILVGDSETLEANRVKKVQ